MDGGNGNDTLNGGDGADTLYGGAGNDVLNGGPGNDTLENGGSSLGNDTYVFDANFGQDVLNMFDYGTGKVDTVVFTSYASTDVASLVRNVNDLVITFTNSTDKLTVVNAFNNPATTYSRPDVWKFADGVTWSDADFKNHNIITYGTAGNDYIAGYDGAPNIIYGYAGDDTLLGGNGNDTLYGGDGNDNLTGNAGDDILNGEAGNDTMYGGDGNDTMDGGIGNDIMDGGNGNDTLNGGDGADTLYGGAGNDVLNGGPGNDVLESTGSSLGNDTYVFDANFGQDTLNMYDYGAGKVDTVVFTSYASSAVVGVIHPIGTNDLVITFAGTTDQLTIVNAFIYPTNTYYRPDVWKFADGVTWSDADILSRAVVQ
jgi:Ca2+-binding RTX toxin-like protein